MPLHNHPGMHGILKVVHGTVEVAFYNRVEIDTPSDLPEPLRNRPDLLERDIVVPTSNPVKVTVGTNSDPLLLYPNKGSSLQSSDAETKSLSCKDSTTDPLLRCCFEIQQMAFFQLAELHCK